MFSNRDQIPRMAAGIADSSVSDPETLVLKIKQVTLLNKIEQMGKMSYRQIVWIEFIFFGATKPEHKETRKWSQSIEGSRNFRE